jgi:hypothetical protein
LTISSDIQTTEKRIGVLLTGHHIVLYLALAGALAFGVYAVESKLASLQEARAQAAEVALATEKDHSAQLSAAFTANQAERDKENAQFLQTLSQLQAQTKVQIIHDKALPAPELGHRIENLTGFKQDTITLDASQDLVVPLPLGQEIAAKLDQGQADAQTIVQQQGIIANQVKTITDESAIIAEDKKVLADQITADAKVLSAEKAKCRKSKWHWFEAGVVVGFVGREILKP